jgi:dTDP-4-dehydrorhamnose 3,5-epimerase
MEPKRDDRGWGLHDIFPEIGVGQINISETYPGVIRAYHRHRNQSDNWRLVSGDIEVRLYYPPDFWELHTNKAVEDWFFHRKIYLHGPDEYVLGISPLVWHGFRVLGNKPATLLYHVTNKYDPENPDEERMAWDAFGPWETEFK